MGENFKDIQEYWEVISQSDLDQDFKDHWIDENGDPVNEKLFKEIAEYIVNFDSSSKTILEVGCGTGRILKNIQIKNKNIEFLELISVKIKLIFAKKMFLIAFCMQVI